MTKKEFLEKIIKNGVKRIGFVPLSVQKDKAMLKVALQEDPEVILFLPDELHTPENFWNTNPKKRYLLLNSKEINNKLPAKMVEWIIDDRTSVVGMSFFKYEFPQFKNFTENAKNKLAISFLIENRAIPPYLIDSVRNFSSLNKLELKEYKSNLILNESLVKIMDEQMKKSNTISNNDSGGFSFDYKI